MNKQDRIKILVAGPMFSAADQAMLEAASDEALGRYETQSTTMKTAQAAAETEKTARMAAEAALKAANEKETPKPTFADVLASADADTQAAIRAAQASAKTTKDTAIKTLKESGRCAFSDAQLQAMDQGQLDNLVTLAGGVKTVNHALVMPPAQVDTEIRVAAAPTNELFNEQVMASRVKK